MTATIRETNVFSDTYLMLYGKISAITDPGGKSRFVFSAFPEKLIDKENAYPLIVLNSADVTYNPLTFKNLKRGPLRLAIEIYSTSASQLDSLCNSVTTKMESEEGNFQISGISVMRLTSSTPNQFTRGNFRVHNKILVYEFDFGWY